ncbi:MAG: hypothetical protein HZA54_11585 [Planctomycetes bacterium]|nr:hypothetical protein [Planctomycetota bacterium]
MTSLSGRRAAGRALGGSGALLLVLCFFLPMIKGCSRPESPFSVAQERVESTCQRLHEGKFDRYTIELIGLAVGVPLPHLFALLVLLRILFSLRGRARADRVVRLAVELLLVTALVVLNGYMFGWAGKYFGSSSMWDRFYTGLTWVAAALVIGWLVWARVRRWPHALFVLSMQKVGGVLCLLWFQYWLVGKVVRAVRAGESPFEEIYYGLPLAALASLLVSIGGMLEGVGLGAPPRAAGRAPDSAAGGPPEPPRPAGPPAAPRISA